LRCWWSDSRRNVVTGPLPSAQKGTSRQGRPFLRCWWSDSRRNVVTGPLPSAQKGTSRQGRPFLRCWWSDSRRNVVTGPLPSAQKNLDCSADVSARLDACFSQVRDTCNWLGINVFRG
jgi:hypothetical protein